MKIEDKHYLTNNKVDKLINWFDEKREFEEGIGLADLHIECITVAYNLGKTDKLNIGN